MSAKKLMLGNEACVTGAIAAGMRFFAGYPITPSTEIAEGCAAELPPIGGKFIQMEDELASIAAVIGASATGLKAMTATSGPGFSLMQENIGYAALAEVPCVIVDVQRVGPSTGMATSPSQGDYMQSRWGSHGDRPSISVSPSSVSEVFSLTVRCFNLSEKYRTPVILLMDETIGHMREGIEIPEQNELDITNRLPAYAKGIYKTCYHVAGRWVPRMAPFGGGERYNITGLIHDESGFPTNNCDEAAKASARILNKVEYNRDDIEDIEEFEMDDAEIAVISYGGTARSAKSAVIEARKLGMRAGLFRPITVWPFPERALKARCSQLKRIVMAELNNGQMLLEVQRITACACPISFIGKLNGTIISPDEILSEIKGGIN